MTFSEKIKTLREQNQLNCKQLAQKANVSIATIHNIEKGRTKPQGAVVKRLSEALGCDFKELYDLL